MTYIYILINAFVSFSFKSNCHDFHISRTEINYDQKTHEVQIAVHIFIDDFESALVKSGSPKLHLCTPKEDQSTDNAIEKYLNNKMKVLVLVISHLLMLHAVQAFMVRLFSKNYLSTF